MTTMKDRIIVPSQDAAKRLDILIAESTGTTRSQVQRLLREGRVLVNERVENQGYRVRTGDVIELGYPEEEEPLIIPEPIPISVLYRDDHLAVVDKPPGMVVYPAAGHERGTMLNALLYYCGRLASIGGPLRNGIVHRLDKDTSGVMVVALDDSAYYDLIEQFRKRTIKRRYTALIYGSLREDSGEIALAIGRSVTDRKKMSTRTRRAKEAVTRWRVIEGFDSATLIEAQLGTGRTHQIRVHFSALGHPVLGDRTYGKKIVLQVGASKVTFPRQMLHAETLGFIHPATREYLEFSTPVPKDMEECIGELRSITR